MEILEKKKVTVKKAILQLKKVCSVIDKKKEPLDAEVYRESLIHRFEFTFEAFWKYLKEYIKQNNLIEIEAPSPNKTFRNCLNQNLISHEEFDILRDATQDRNSTTHTYEEELAIIISERIINYCNVMEKIAERL